MHPKIAARRLEVESQPNIKPDEYLKMILSESNYYLSCIERRDCGRFMFQKEREFCQHGHYLLETTASDTQEGIKARAYIFVGLNQMRDIMRAIARRA